MKALDLAFWEILGKKPCLVFGQESGAAALWMFVILVVKTVFTVLRIQSFVSYGILFACPFGIQWLVKYFPFLRQSYPILPVRLAESLIGRVSPSKLVVIVPAHMLGCVFATVLFKAIFPIIPNQVFQPIVYSGPWLNGFLIELGLVFVYTCIVIVLPDLLEVNKLNSMLLSVPILPLLLIPISDKTSTFNPASIYALWYVNRGNIGNEYNIQLEHIIGPIVAAIFAGLFCNYMFPDDPSSWKRKNSNYS